MEFPFNGLAEIEDDRSYEMLFLMIACALN